MTQVSRPAAEPPRVTRAPGAAGAVEPATTIAAARPPGSPAARPNDGIARLGRVAARTGWALAAVALLGLGVAQLVTAVLAARVLDSAVGSHSGVLAAVILVIMLLAGGLTCLVCAPGCAARALHRRLGVRRPRWPRAVRALEVCARVLTGACLVAAALEAHDPGHLPAAVRVGAGATLSAVALHPASLIAVGLAAATLSRRWSRVAGRAAILTAGRRGSTPR